MPTFRDAADLEAVIGEFLRSLAPLDEVVREATARSPMTVQIRVVEPAMTVLLDLETQPLRVSLGNRHQQATITIKVAADTLHLILLGREDFARLTNIKGLLVKGPMYKLVRFYPLFELCPTIYQEHLDQQGRTDLLMTRPQEDRMSLPHRVAKAVGRALELHERPRAEQALRGALGRSAFAAGYLLGLLKGEVLPELDVVGVLAQLAAGLERSRRPAPPDGL